VKIFTLMSRDEIDKLIEEHNQAPHLRVLQKALAREITIRVHSEEALKGAEEASQILFGKATTEALRRLDEKTLLSVFDGVPTVTVSKEKVSEGRDITEFLAAETAIFASKGEARRMLKDNGLSVNKEKVNDTYQISNSDLLNGRYILIQKGKKNYYLVIVE